MQIWTGVRSGMHTHGRLRRKCRASRKIYTRQVRPEKKPIVVFTVDIRRASAKSNPATALYGKIPK